MPVYNGVGAYWMPKWLRNCLTQWYLRDFSESYPQEHDLGYWLREQSRLTLDRQLLDAMLLEATNKRQIVKAWVIYIVVRAFGHKSYTRNKTT